MSNPQETMFSNAQAKTNEWVQSAMVSANAAKDNTVEAAVGAKDRTIEACTVAKDKTVEAAILAKDNTMAQLTKESAQPKPEPVPVPEQTPNIFQQTGTQVVNMAQGAVETVKNTFGGAGEQAPKK